MPRTIHIDLSVNYSIESAIGEIDDIIAEIRRRTGQLVERLTNEGVEIARVQVISLGAIYTGDLLNSIEGFYDPVSHVGIISANVPYAAYVEYGTGIVGSANPHPAYGEVGWVYDVNEHGDQGWIYLNPNDDKFHWTAGMSARPFMYNTALQLRELCAQIAREVFA